MLSSTQIEMKSEKLSLAAGKPHISDELLPKPTTTRKVRELLGVFEAIGKEAESLSKRTAGKRRLEAMGMKREALRRAAVTKEPDRAQNSLDSWFGRFEGGPQSGFLQETVTQLNEYVLGGMAGNDQFNWLITQVAREAVRENLPQEFLLKYPEPLRSVIASRMGL